MNLPGRYFSKPNTDNGKDEEKHGVDTKYGEEATQTDPVTGEVKHGVKMNTMLPARTQNGPHGLGDPRDKAVLHTENDTIIKKRMYTAARHTVCKEETDVFDDCFKREGDFWVLFNCRKTLNAMNACIISAMKDPNFHQKVTDDFVAERSTVRASGLTLDEQRLERYRQWKREQALNTPADSVKAESSSQH